MTGEACSRWIWAWGWKMGTTGGQGGGGEGSRGWAVRSAGAELTSLVRPVPNLHPPGHRWGVRGRAGEPVTGEGPAQGYSGNHGVLPAAILLVIVLLNPLQMYSCILRSITERALLRTLPYKRCNYHEYLYLYGVVLLVIIIRPSCWDAAKQPPESFSLLGLDPFITTRVWIGILGQVAWPYCGLQPAGCRLQPFFRFSMCGHGVRVHGNKKIITLPDRFFGLSCPPVQQRVSPRSRTGARIGMVGAPFYQRPRRCTSSAPT